MRPRPPARSVSNGSTSSSNGSRPKSMSSSGGNTGNATKPSINDGSDKEKSVKPTVDKDGAKPSSSTSTSGVPSKPASVSSSTGGGGSTKSSTGNKSGGGGSSSAKVNPSGQSNKSSSVGGGGGGGNQCHASGQGNINSVTTNSHSSAPKKKKKPQVMDRNDASLLHRVPTDTAMSGVHDIVTAVTSGTDELCDIITNECYVLYECKVCRNFFRNIANLFQHKKAYCTSRFIHFHDSFQNKEIQEKSLVFNNGTKGHVLFSRKTTRRDILDILDKIAERRVEREPSFIAFREMCDTASALLTAVVPERKSDERSATITLPSPSPVKNSSGGNHAHSENHNGVNHHSPSSSTCHNESPVKVPCPKCDKDFPSKYSLESHVNSVHPDVRLGYLCPCCDQVFVNSWCVNRHLTTAHKKNRDEIRVLRLKIEKKIVPTETLFPERGSRRRATSFSSSSNDEDSDDDDKKEPEVTFPCAHCPRTFLRKAAMISHRNYCRLRDPEQRVPPIHSSGGGRATSSSVSGKRARSPSVESCHSDKKEKKIREINEPRVLLTRTSLPGPVENEPPVKDEKQELEASRIEDILGIKADSVVNTPSKEKDEVDDDVMELQKAHTPVKMKSILDPPEEPQEILSCPGCHRIFLRKAAMASHAILCRVKPDSLQLPPAKKAKLRRPSESQQVTQKQETTKSQQANFEKNRVGSSFGMESAQSDAVQMLDIEDFLGVKLSSQVNFINTEDSAQGISNYVSNVIKNEEKEEEAMDEDEEAGESGSSERSEASGDSGGEDDPTGINGENEYSESDYESESDRDGEGFEDFENTVNAASGQLIGNDEEEEEDAEISSIVDEEEDSAITVSSEMEESRIGEVVASVTDIEDDSNAWNTDIQLTKSLSNVPDHENVSVKIEEEHGEHNEWDNQSKGSDDDVTEGDIPKDEWIRKKLDTFVDPKCRECLICFQRFKRIDEARNHVALHFNLKAYKCLVNSCGFRSFPREVMARHVIAEHKKTRKLCWNFIEKLKVRVEDFPDSVPVMNVSTGGGVGPILNGSM